MLRILTLSTLFPSAVQPTFGVFVERQTMALAAREDAEVEVISAIGLPPWPLRLHPRYRGRAQLPLSERWKGLTVHRPRFRLFPPRRHQGDARALAKAILPLLHQIHERYPFGVLDAEFFWPDGVAAYHLSKSFGLPFSIKARGSDILHWGHQPGFAEQMVEAADAASGLMAVSGALRRQMIELGMPGDKISVHHTGIDHTRFNTGGRAQAKAALGVAGPLIVTPGALIPIKGQRLAIEALRELEGTTLLLVGDGPDRHALEKFAAARGVNDRVRFLGNRPHEELPGLLAAADVMVLPSEREGLANVWVESLACGTPLVIPDVGGAREVLDRPEAGMLVAREPAAIARAVAAILASPPKPGAVSAAAERFSWDRNSQELFDHLSRVACGGLRS